MPRLIFIYIIALFSLNSKAFTDSSLQQWKQIAEESQSFSVSDSVVIRYGSYDIYTVKAFSANRIVSCDNNTFGDPLPNKKKYCYVDNDQNNKNSINSSVKIANEHEIFNVPSGTVVRYGASSSWITRVAGNKGICDNNYFGSDPKPSAGKSCYKDQSNGEYYLASFLDSRDKTNDNASVSLVQMNVAGAEFTPQELPGKLGKNYIFPSSSYLDKWQKFGIKVIRFPILWERLQPTPHGPLETSYSKEIDALLNQAEERKMGVIIDIHNYGRYYKKVVGTPEVDADTYKDLMKRIANRWGGHPGLHGYDLMNEPYGEADKYWKEIAQTGIDAIRFYDRIKPIYVQGRSYSSAESFNERNSDLLLLDDPGNNLIFSAHLYLDANNSGFYNDKDSGAIDSMIGVKRATPFVQWLKQNKKRGHIGEFGIPGNDPRWLSAMDNLLKYLNANCIPMAYWAAGPWWGNYVLSVEPSNGIVPAQLPVLENWTKKKNDKCLANTVFN
jgi:endoglucanase